MKFASSLQSSTSVTQLKSNMKLRHAQANIHKAGLVFSAILIIFIAFWLRVEHLDVMPPGLSNDEATDAVDALHISQTWNFPLYEDLGRPDPLFHITQGIAAFFFGSSIWALRFTSALFGTLTIASCYWAILQCVHNLKPGQRQIAALGGMAALAVAIGHITLSRTLYRAVPQPLFMFLFVGFLLRGLRRYQFRDFVLSGFWLALSVYTYTAAFTLPLSIILVGLSLLIFQFKSWRKWLPRMLLLGLTLTILLLPVGILIATAPQRVFGRATAVSNTQSVESIEALNRLTLQLFTRGDENPQYNAAEAPILPPVFNILFVIGLVSLAMRVYRPETTLIFALLVLAAIPAVAAQDVTHGLRINGEYAVFPIVIAAGIGGIFALIKRFTLYKTFSPFLKIALIAGFGWNVFYAHTTYVDYWQQPLTWRMFERDLPLNEWFFRTDRREFAEWLSQQTQSMLVPLDELNQQTTRAWLSVDYPTLRTAGDDFQLPAQTLLVVPWAIETDDLQRQTRHYGLLTEHTITLLPPFSEATHADLLANIDQAEAINRTDGSIMGRLKPLSSDFQITFEPQTKQGMNGNPVAIFGDDLQLMAWRGTDTLEGQEFIYTLDWQSRQRRIGHYYSTFLQLQTQDFERVTGDDVLVWRWLYPTSIWQQGDIVYDRHIMTVSDNLAPGAYRLVAGVYAFVDNPLMALTPDGETAGNSATIGWVKVPQTQTVILPLEAVKVDAELAGVLMLRGALVTLDNPDRLRIVLYWESLVDRPNIDATIFVHIVDAEETIIAQQDARPWNGQYPTFIWDEEELVQTEHVMDIQGPSVENLELLVGMYTFPDLTRLTVTEDGNTSPDGRIRVGKISQIMAQ